MTRACLGCGADISSRSNSAKRCLPCGDQKNREHSRDRSREVRSQAHMPRVNNQTSVCICCGNKFRPTKARTRLCRECYTGGSGVVEYSLRIAF